MFSCTCPADSFFSLTFSIDLTIKLYTTSAIQEHVDPHLTNDGFLTLAICCGSDYDKASQTSLLSARLMRPASRKDCQGVAMRWHLA
jgi:hypothetical protein